MHTCLYCVGIEPAYALTELLPRTKWVVKFIKMKVVIVPGRDCAPSRAVPGVVRDGLPLIVTRAPALASLPPLSCVVCRA